ncbi:hypothetical protein [Gaopeijia maritima]|uniref:Uncharacterized protein n=1 Tax=Gaopeijia maritima TaxID=3119007 RepID=A0ABU9E7N6_9BACT
MSRLTLPAAGLLVAALVVWSAYLLGARAGHDALSVNLLINLGTEIMGIVITVAVVEWFFERRRNAERGKQVAWSALHAVEHVVWVWQGGPRQVETDQILGILRSVSSTDPLPDFTQNLLLGLGARSKQTLHNDQAALEAHAGLMTAFEELARLNAIREGGRVLAPRTVADVLEEGVKRLARVLGQPEEVMPGRLIRYVDATEEAQELRYFGRDAEPGPRRLERGGPEVF